ncbi:MAG: ABC transporter permease [Selenomonadaceae bacterium]
MIRLRALLIKEFIQMKRDNLTLALMILMPMIQLLVFGFAIHTDVKHLSTVVFDQSLTEESRDLLNSFTASEYFDINYVVSDFATANALVDSGKAKVAVLIPPDLAPNLKHGRPTPIQVIVDASDSTSASSAIAAAQSIGQLKSKEILLAQKQISPAAYSLYDVRIRSWYNRDFVTAYYMVPGIMGIILTMTMVMITSMAIVRERETGTLEQLIVTPLKTYELMIGKIIPYIVMGYVQATISLLVGLAVFDLPIRGSLPLLYGLTSFFIIASLSLGVLISSVSRTQMQAMQMSFFVFMPSVLLSGFMFPRDAMPKIFYILSQLLPMTYYIEILRGIILRGNSLSLLWAQVLSLIVFISATLGLAIKKFTKTLD